MQDKTEEKQKVKVLTKEKADLDQLLGPPEKKLAVAGHSITRTDDPAKVTGKLMYGADYPPGRFSARKNPQKPPSTRAHQIH